MSTLSKSTLFPTVLAEEMINAVRGKSALAKLSGQRPIPFNGQTEFVFTLDKEADIVAENGAKSVGGATVTQKIITPIKFEYGARVSDEFMYASDEARLDTLRTFAEGFAAKMARALDISALHGLNPRTHLASSVVGNNHFDYAIPAGSIISGTSDPDADVENAVGAVIANEHEVTGIAMTPSFRSNLASLVANGVKRYPELAWGASPDTINGLKADVNTTVDYYQGDYDAYVGDFQNFFRWGYAKDIPLEVIEFGNPDNDADAGDLKGHNQVYLRAEAYIGWVVLDGKAFAKIAKATSL